MQRGTASGGGRLSVRATQTGDLGGQITQAPAAVQQEASSEEQLWAGGEGLRALKPQGGGTGWSRAWGGSAAPLCRALSFPSAR